MGRFKCSRILMLGALFAMTAASVAATNVPGKIEAEAYAAMAGVQLETCSEGTQNVGWIETGDWMAYAVTVPSAGSYTLQYRVASPNSNAVISADYNAGANQLGTVAVPNTGGWQNWQTVSQTVTLPAGTYNLGVFAQVGGFNLNWINVVSNTSTSGPAGYTWCAGENGSYTFGQSVDVAYGANGSFNYKTGVSGTITFNNATFGDPIVGVAKAGYYKTSTKVGPAGYTWCADENGSYTFNQTVDVAYGANGAFVYKSGVSGAIAFNNATFGDPISGVVKAGYYKAASSTASLIPLAGGKQMTFQFQNNTGGKYADNQIYVLMIARDNSGRFCWLDKNGNMNLCVAGQNASSYSIKMSDFAGFQFPTFLDSGRLYVSLGSPLNININSDINGNVGIAFPNIENASDPNINTYFEWVEFAVINNAIWCNTTQVDQFGFPMTMELFQGSSSSYTSFGKVGVTESRASIWNSWNATVPNEFKGLATTTRILAPLHGSFRAGQANGNYFDGYINSVWSQYSSSGLVITVPQGTFTGRVLSDSRMMFTRPGDSAGYYVNKPTSEAVWGGLGALATGNTIELVLEAQICAAFHRHVIDNASLLNNVSQYYHAGPADYFSKFWHDHSINARAYGFCYDDVNDQSSTLTCGSPRGIILSIGF